MQENWRQVFNRDKLNISPDNSVSRALTHDLIAIPGFIEILKLFSRMQDAFSAYDFIAIKNKNG